MTPDTRTHDRIQLDAQLMTCACGLQWFATHQNTDQPCWVCQRHANAERVRQVLQRKEAGQ